MNRKASTFILASLFMLLLSTSSYSMGGGAPSESDQTPPSDDKRVEQIDKARAEIKQDRAELDKIEKYMWSLDTKITDARNSENTKRLLDLKEQEQDTLERARLLKGDISRLMEQYPELKVSEALEAAKENPQPVQQAQQAEQPAMEQQQAVQQQVMPPVPVPPVTMAPAPRPVAKPVVKKVVQSSYIVYHEVESGDTLFGISRKYFGTPSLYKEIAKQNNITEANGLKQGMVLKIDLRWKSMVTPRPVAVPAPAF